MNGQGSFFDAAQAPARWTPSACPACGADLIAAAERREGRCRRCIAAGIIAGRLGLESDDIAESCLTDEAIAAAGEVADEVAEARLIAELDDDEDRGPVLEVIGQGGRLGRIYADGTPAPADSRAAHAERCAGVLMAPMFGLGRTSCNVCDWSPSDG